MLKASNSSLSLRTIPNGKSDQSVVLSIQLAHVLPTGSLILRVKDINSLIGGEHGY